LIVFYSQSNAPFCHSYTKPNVRTNKNQNIEKIPIIPTILKTVEKGNKNEISKSKIIKRIATK